MSTSPEQEPPDMTQAPEEGVQAAAKNSISESAVSQLRELGGSGANFSRQVLRGYPPACAELLEVDPQAAAVAAKGSAGGKLSGKDGVVGTLHRNIDGARGSILQFEGSVGQSGN